MADQRIPPPQQGMSAYQYYQQLTGMGIGAYDAYQATSAAYGAPKSPEQQAADQAAANSRSNLAAQAGQIAGILGGSALGGYTAGLFGPGTAAVAEGTAAAGAAGAAGSGAATAPVVATLPSAGAAAGAAGAGAIGAGVTTIPAGASIPAGYTAIGSAANGGTMIMPAGEAASSGAMGSLATYAGPLAIAAGLYGGYQTANMIGDTAAGSQRNQQAAFGGAASGAALGAGVGTMIGGPVIGTAIGAAVGTIAGAVGSWTGSHKGKAQVMRDNIRGVLQENKVLDPEYKGTLADGSLYDFGQDGSTLKWKNVDKIAEAQPSAWNAAVPMADALAASYGFVGQKASDIAAWYAKGAVSNAGDDSNIARANMQHFAKQQGITMDLVKSKLDEAIKDNRISQTQYDYYMMGANQLLGATGAAPMPQPPQPPKAGEVQRVSPGMYMNDQGKVQAAKTARQALEMYYGKGK